MTLQKVASFVETCTAFNIQIVCVTTTKQKKKKKQQRLTEEFMSSQIQHGEAELTLALIALFCF